MAWYSVFVVFRLLPELKFVEVYRTDDLKQAKYWLGFIARPGDVLCRTPKHPKHPRSSEFPEYISHKQSTGGVTASNLAQWHEFLVQANCLNASFPSSQDQLFPESNISQPGAFEI